MDCQEIYNEADLAGREAAKKIVPVPMVLEEVGVDNKPYPGSKSYFVETGPCGFAWIKIRPGNCKFAKWLKQKGIVDDLAYDGGYDIWVSGFGQSICYKEAYAEAFAEVLRKYGINAVGQSRLD